MTLLQLNPLLPVITTAGKALAHFLIDMGIEHDLHWVCFLDGNGQCWTYRNQEIMAISNLTYGRDYIFPFYDPQELELPKGTKHGHS